MVILRDLHNMDFDKLKNLLRLNEGKRNALYFDTEGFATIGVGHNLDAKPISNEAVEQILDDDLKDVIKEVATLACWEALDDVRQAVIIDMCFNLGLEGLCKFRKMFSALILDDYEEAAKEMLDSKWSKQVGDRALRLERMMRSGEWF